MTELYACLTDHRRERLLPTPLNGIDYVEVGAAQDRLDVFFVKPDNLGTLTPALLFLTGGMRFPPPQVLSVAVSPADPTLLHVTLKPNQPTDFSSYRLTLRTLAGGTPAGFDRESASVAFSFKINCPSPFDCAGDAVGLQDAPAPDPDLDYTARDWSGFRGLMLDRISTLLPGFADDTPVDHLVTQVEALAYVADHLSYRLDAVANDTDIFRARSRIALARHARLVDYPVHEGSNARVFVQIAYAGVAGPSLPRGTPLTVTTDLPGVTILPEDFAKVAPFEPLTFETMQDLALQPGNNHFGFHTWSAADCTLRRGATSATLRRAFEAGMPDGVLQPGDFLILKETVSPETGSPADANRQKRHVVRLTRVEPATDLVEAVTVFNVAWDIADALPFDLVLSGAFTHAGATTRTILCAEALGNIVLADHGLTFPVASLTPSAKTQALTPKLDPAMPPAATRWQPRLTRGPVIRAAALNLSTATSASLCLRNDPAQALPALTLRDSFKPWTARRDLLSSERFDRHFVVETQTDGTVHLRFGDDIMGQKPLPGDRLSVAARIGRHSDGGIGADVLKQAVTALAGITAVSNPMAAVGGMGGIPASRVRIEAPYAFRTQERAVTEADYAEVAMRHPAVSSARARVRWTGSWRTSFVYIDRVGGGPVERDPRFRAALLRHMDRYRLCGIDIALRDAIAVPLDLTLSICALPDSLRTSVRRDLTQLLGSGLLPDGRRSFFHPDNFTFGTALYLSQLIAAVVTVPGLSSAEVTALGRRGKPDIAILAQGVIAPAEFEVLRLDNDPNFPENGLLTLDIRGGK